MILGFVGPAQVKGFAITLAIGVIASMISSHTCCTERARSISRCVIADSGTR